MSSTKQEYDQLIKERHYARARLSRIFNKVTTEYGYSTLIEPKKADFIVKLNELRNSLTAINEKIHAILPSDEDEERLLDEEETYDNKIVEALDALKPRETHSQAESNNSTVETNCNRIKLPTVALPTFSNDKAESLENFIYAFESIISKQTLSDYEKFIYLKGQLQGGPLALVRSRTAARNIIVRTGIRIPVDPKI